MYLKYCDHKGGNFPQKCFGLKTGQLFSFTFMVRDFMLSIRLNFVGQSVLYSGVYLSDSHQIYMTRLAD